MSNRYATLITNDEGEEIVSNIAQLEGEPIQPATGRVVRVPDTIKIGDIYKGAKAAVAKGRAKA